MKTTISNTLAIACCAVALTSFSSCIDTSDSSGMQRNEITMSTELPEELADASITSGKVTFTEINTRSTYTFALPMYDPWLIPDGLYDVEAQAVATDADSKAYNLRATMKSVEMTSATNIDFDWFYFIPSSSLVFSEIYVVGSLNAKGTGGLRDTYFRIYNNSDEVVYADGIAIVESTLLNTKTNAFEILTEANNRQVNFTAGTVLVVPGSGTDYPLQPGESIKITDQAINWGNEVAGALDHSNADFEWYDENAQDTDNPDVTNLDKWYCYSLSIWIPSSLANRSYAIVKFPEGMTAEQYLLDYYGPYEYIGSTGATMMNQKAYLIPNSWILDGVNLSNDEVFVYGALADNIDMSYSACSTVNSDKERFGKVMVRKVASVLEDGRLIYKDTNDSKNDFELVPANSL